MKLRAGALACCLQGPEFRFYHWKKKEGKSGETAVRKPALDELCFIHIYDPGRLHLKGILKYKLISAFY